MADSFAFVVAAAVAAVHAFSFSLLVEGSVDHSFDTHHVYPTAGDQWLPVEYAVGAAEIGDDIACCIEVVDIAVDGSAAGPIRLAGVARDVAVAAAVVWVEVGAVVAAVWVSTQDLYLFFLDI